MSQIQELHQQAMDLAEMAQVAISRFPFLFAKITIITTPINHYVLHQSTPRTLTSDL
ncbi:hypothetical protein MEN41_06440 [Dolichospermum sp. ST_con]|nr:hypothetical protein [Dolichospermum sp. ST_con]MDD1417547.1 hypothetical protein [Dolichospermum sp. ST_sed1]MDD1422994.1 hypothetical protein [Dolichospermum sp. ST_sed9]MDD1431809.1 hypothetical protein [Dolichospermum sp. ST_sed6]MDD1438312.1 hypothetical protein [Dolichospermum sp. ST_sed10]MDD1440739.1 hypothetical protein [Dolichospermum sp. ST_sed3]MDD1448001.1 hypothetical protein [Dolichospermum sp. ST_sed8]MDD1456942.1 hypothetical protein [Dolichospermum sp. ST_sed7]MDD145863